MKNVERSTLLLWHVYARLFTTAGPGERFENLRRTDSG